MKTKTVFLIFLALIVTARLSTIPAIVPEKQAEGPVDDGGSVSILKEDNGFSVPGSSLKSAEMDYGSAPYWNWIETFSGSGQDYTQDLETDSDGNVYLTGYFSGTITIAQKNLVSVGDRDGLIAKFDPLGGLLWIYQLEGVPGSDINIWELTIAPDNSVYATGAYSGNVTIGGVPMANSNKDNLFVIGLNADGSELTAFEHTSINDSQLGFDIDLDDAGNIYVLAAVGTSIFNKASPSLLVKFAPNGTVTWEKEFDERFSALDISGTGLYVAGTLASSYGMRSGPMDGILDGNVTLTHPYGYEDAFAAKADLDGVFEWGTMVEHVDSMVGDSYSDHLYADENGNVYFSGRYRQEITLGLFNNFYASGSQETFFARLNPDGSFVWGWSHPGENKGIEPDAEGTLLVSDGPVLVTLDTIYGDYTPWVQLEYTPRALASFINPGNSLENARYATGLRNGNMVLSKNDVYFSAVWLAEFTGNSGYGEVYSMVADDQGYFYVFGKIGGKVDYFGKTLKAGSFLSKHTTSGDLVWVNEFPGVFLDVGTEIPLAIDHDHRNLYITGRFTGELELGADARLFTAEGQYEFFVAKYSTSGAFQWVYEGSFDPQELAIAPDHSGNVLLSGIATQPINIAGTPIPNQGGNDAFVTKLNSSGVPIWAFGLGGESVEYMCYVATDASDNIYLSGEFISDTIMIGQTQFAMGEGDGNVFLAKLDKDANIIWVKPKAGSTRAGGDNLCWPTGLVTDPAGNIYIKGWHGDSTYFDSIMLRSTRGNFGYFNAKIDTEGNTVWANTINEGQNYGFDYNTFDVDDAGNVYLGAQSRDTLWFGSDFVYSEVEPGHRDLFVAQYKANGDLGWVKTIGGDQNWSTIEAVAVVDSNRIFVGAYFRSILELDEINLTTSNSTGLVAMLTSTSKPKITYTKTDVSEPGGNDGSIDVTVSGGLPPFIYAWSNGAKTEDINKLLAGEYELNVTDAAGNTNFQEIIIDEPADTVCGINAEFRFSVADQTLGLENLSTGLNNGYAWSFGDGTLSNMFEPEHTFDKAGTYRVCLTVFDTVKNCLEEVCHIVEIGELVCVADFGFYYDDTDPNKLFFTNTSEGAVSSFMWLFGDGSVSTEQNPAHTFDQPGFYDVSFIVVDKNGTCMDQYTETIRVGSADCNADFSYFINASSGTTQFSSKDMNSGSTFYWLFGDGSTSTEKDPIHDYTYPGFYKVSLSVYNETSGCIASKEKIILVGEGADVEADFIYQVQTNGTNVSFQDKSLGDDLSYYWDFGDGTFSSLQNPIHDYIVEGYYNVCLNAYGANGLQNITCKRVFVGQDASTQCLADFTFLVDDNTKTVTYSDRSFGKPDVFVWDLGDQSTSNEKNPIHTYSEAGYYLVQHMIENTANNCKDYAFKLVNVDSEEGLVAGFGAVVDSSNKKADTYPVDFVGVSLGDAGKLKWDFGDGNIDTTSLTPTHTYSEPGTYTVCLYLSNPTTGQADTSCQTITVDARGNVGTRDYLTQRFELSSYPNPFSEYSTVSFRLEKSTMVDLAVYDLMGRKVKQMVRDYRDAGIHQLELKGSDLEGGHYYMILRTPDAIERTVITVAR